ncbi:MAG: response regulator [Lutibacter sp.]|uniref:response regulator n=1 Tax=Lutibacter sp. TaxID=1925666 RepID=UPI0017FA6536|nr:response regulator [Lutibacter sp.]MBT8318326.1 response regulator [Lutibacter sp.]NNJ59184.1 response regulator [Lutibacter sp.]
MLTLMVLKKNRKIIGNMPIKLLIVEDDIEISQFTEKKLNEKGIFSIFCVSTFNEAITYLNNNNPSDIILDLRLPDGNGVDILKYIQKKDIKPSVYVFTSSSELEQTCLRLGADGFFDKAEGTEQLIKTILSN